MQLHFSCCLNRLESSLHVHNFRIFLSNLALYNDYIIISSFKTPCTNNL